MTIFLNDGLLQIFDVEHGGCALLTIPRLDGTHHRILIDCGHNASSKWYPGEHLKRLDIKHLELLVVTNYDEDHVSGLHNFLLQGITIGQILRNPTVTPSTIRKLKSKDGMGIGIETLIKVLTAIPDLEVGENHIPMPASVNLEWYWNPYPFFEDENNLSLILVLEVHGVRFMFCGDMEKLGFRNLLKTCQPFQQVVSTIHVLVAAHHGRANGICEEMFDTWACRPEAVVISDDYKQYDTQETVAYYGRKAKGFTGFRSELGLRRVLTTRCDKELFFSFLNGRCYVS